MAHKNKPVSLGLSANGYFYEKKTGEMPTELETDMGITFGF